MSFRTKMKPGDWICENCGDHQFARNQKCRMCNADKPETTKTIARFEVKPGDWICKVCGDHQFAKNVFCRMCGVPKDGQQDEYQCKKDYYIVLDFEANCSGENQRDYEIIEFPAVLVNSKTGKIISEFRTFCKLVKHKELSKFIRNLTNITDEQCKGGSEWSECLKMFEKWCLDNGISSENATVVTCGDWDLKSMLPLQLLTTKTKLSPFLNDLLGCWNNVKVAFTKLTKIRGFGMARMLDHFKLTLDGQHHSGIDDCRNTVKICNEVNKIGGDVSTPNKVRLEQFWYPNHCLSWKRNKKGRILKNCHS